MNTLIVYYSFTGNNRVLAQDLAARMGADIFEIVEQKHRSWGTILLDQLFNRRPRILQPVVAWDRYDRVILIAPVWNALLASPMCTFIRKEKTNLKNYFVVTVCGGREGQQGSIRKQLAKLAGKLPVTITQFAINDRLPEERKRAEDMGIIKINNSDLQYFQADMHRFIETLEAQTASAVITNVQ